jgi:mannosyltransferase
VNDMTRNLSDAPSRSGRSLPRDPSITKGLFWSRFDDRSDSLVILFVGFALGAAVFLRWSGIASQSLWMDEGYTLWISRFSPKDIWHVLQFDTSTPLYYILIHYWTKCFGESDFSLRALSAVFGTVSFPLFYLLARKILADKIAVILAMFLYALSFFQIWYAQEARCYALLVFLCLVSIYCLLLFLEHRTTSALCGLVVSLTASLYTHNMALFYLPAIALMWLIYPAERAMRARVMDLSLVFAIVFLLYIPWVPTLRAQWQAVHAEFWLPAPAARNLLESLCVFSGFDTSTFQSIFRERFHAVRLFGFWTWAPAVLMIFVFCALGSLYATRSADRRKLTALLLYSLTPVVLVFVDSRISTPIYIDRVFLGSCVLLPMVFCAPVAFHVGTRKKVFQMTGFVVVVWSVVSAFGYLRRQRKEDWKGVTEYLLKRSARPQLLVVVPDMGQVLIQHYDSESSKSYPPLDETGLRARFDPPDLGLEERILDNRNADVTALLEHATGSGRYTEVDVAMQPAMASPLLVGPALEYLSAHCASVEVVEFHWLEVRRCFVQSK